MITRCAIFNSHVGITIQALFSRQQYGNTRHDPVDFRAGFRFSGPKDNGTATPGDEGEEDAESVEGMQDKANQKRADASQEIDAAGEKAQEQGEKDAENADGATVTHTLAESAAKMTAQVTNVKKDLEKALMEVERVLLELSYLTGLSEVVAEKTPSQEMPVEERRFKARSPSLLQRLSQQQPHTTQLRPRFQARGRVRR